MEIINYISSIAMPLIILLIILYGVSEKNKVFDTFIKGAKEGVEIVKNLFPTLLGIFFAIAALRNSGIIDLIVKIIQPILNIFNIPAQIMPLAILRPISGSASMAIATDIMKQYGVDSNIGMISSVIMGATETTFYTIAIYTSSVGIKKTRYIIVAALIADIIGIITSVVICRIMSENFSWQIKKNVVI